MSFTDTQIDQLSAKLNSAHVKKNPKGYDYVEGWHAMSEANRIFGFDGWNREIMNLKCLHDPYQNDKDNWGVSYGCTVRITVRAGDVVITRDGTGYGSGFAKDIGSAHESAIKEAETDAMKRAFTTFGNQFGLALYDKEKANVETPLDPVAYVSGAKAWLQRQTTPQAINSGWSEELDNFVRLPLEAQQDLTAARDQRLAQLAPKPNAAPADDWKLIGDTIKAEIDNALDTVAIRDILESKQFLDLEAHSKSAGAFLRDRANKRAGVIAQTGRKAA